MKTIAIFLLFLVVTLASDGIGDDRQNPYDAKLAEYFKVSVEALPSYTQSEAINVKINITNNDTREHNIQHPVFKDLTFYNIELRLTNQNDSNLYQEIHQQKNPIKIKELKRKILPNETVFYEFNLLPYCNLYDKKGKFSLNVFLESDEKEIYGSINFVIKERKELYKKSLKTAMFSAIKELTHTDITEIKHSLYVVNDSDVTKLIYESDVPRFPGNYTVCQGNVKDFEIVYLSRDIQSCEGIMYDEDMVLTQTKTKKKVLTQIVSGKDVIELRRVKQNFASECECIAVPYINNSTLYLWVIGKYGPIPRQKRSLTTNPSIMDVLCESKKIADNVKVLGSVKVNSGSLTISYTDKNDNQVCLETNETGNVSVLSILNPTKEVVPVVAPKPTVANPNNEPASIWNNKILPILALACLIGFLIGMLVKRRISKSH